MTTHSMFIEELIPEGDRWRITIRELGQAQVLSQEMFPSGAPHGVTIAEDIIQTEPDLIGSFLVGGIDSDTLPHMADDYAQRFREAGLVPHRTTMALEGAPQDGYVRTWFAGNDDPWDMPEDEAVELHADNWDDVTLPELTVWDRIDDQTITFQYANGMTYPVPLAAIEQSQMPAHRLLNHSNYLIIPADESLNPVLSARTVPRMFALRLALNEADREAKEKQLEIGFMVQTFQQQIARLAKGSRWKSPVDVFRDGLGKR